MTHVVTENVYVGRDNVVSVVLTADDSAVDLSAVTRIVLVAGHVTVDSDVDPDAFDWSFGGGRVDLALGDVLAVPWTGYVRLITFDASNPDGLVWVSEQSRSRLQIRVIE